MKKMLLACNVALAILLIGAYVAVDSLEPAASGPAGQVERREVAAPFELPVIGRADGETVRLSDFAGRPVVLNFWASWCDACKAERDELFALRERTGAEFLGIATSDDILDLKQSEETRPHPYRVAHDASDAVANAYDVTGLPTTIVVGADGRMLKRVSRGLRPSDTDEISALVGVKTEAKR